VYLSPKVLTLKREGRKLRGASYPMFIQKTAVKTEVVAMHKDFT